MADDFKIIGNKEVEKALKKVADAEKLFDKDFKKVVQQGYRELKIKTLSKEPGSKSFGFKGMNVTAKNLKTGLTANAWKINKRGLSDYSIDNNRKTSDGKHFIVDLIEKGHRGIRPKFKKQLYMPLSRSGQAKAHGVIDKSLKYGKDFILLDRVKPRKGRKFINSIVKKGNKELFKLIVDSIRKVY